MSWVWGLHRVLGVGLRGSTMSLGFRVSGIGFRVSGVRKSAPKCMPFLVDKPFAVAQSDVELD